MAYQREHKPSSWNSQAQQKRSQFASNPFAAQVQPKSDTSLTQTEIEDEALEQHQFEAFGLQLKQKSGAITPEETQRLGILQAKVDDFWIQRRARTEGQPNLLEILSRNAGGTPETEPATLIQPKLTENEFGNKYDQEAESEKPSEASADLEASIEEVRGSGQPLAEPVREPMEREFGADFSGVRVHTDATSDVLNQSIQAKAFTTGSDIFFRQGLVSRGVEEGRS